MLGEIPDDEAVIRAGNLGEPVARGTSPVSLAYRAIAARLMGQEETEGGERAAHAAAAVGAAFG